MISVTFPIAQEFIKAEAARVRGELNRLDAERAVTATLLRQIQAFCVHEGQEHYMDRGGYPDSTPCKKCGSCE